ncbi:hypothetical protein P7C70_g5636, partial [Phenoliferia sp. Uapishka_3]
MSQQPGENFDAATQVGSFGWTTQAKERASRAHPVRGSHEARSPVSSTVSIGEWGLFNMRAGYERADALELNQRFLDTSLFIVKNLEQRRGS